MTLFEILEEISVGYHQNNPESQKLKKYVKEVIDILSEENAVYENRKLMFSVLSERIESNLEGNTFLQGSYGTSTAIKHKLYDVDADIAFIIDNDKIDLKIRDIIYTKLFEAFGNKYIVEKKKPCITIDFKNKYKIDVAIYTKVNNRVYFHNSIGGIEKVDEAKPKELIGYFNSCYKENDTRRKVIRLIKHFIKTSNMALDINDNNKMPSIAINLLLCEQKMHTEANEKELYQDVLSSIKYMKVFIETNEYEGPRKEELCVGNTFYKIEDISEVKKVINRISLMFERKQYDQLIESNIYNKINNKNLNKVDGSFTGTMG